MCFFKINCILYIPSRDFPNPQKKHLVKRDEISFWQGCQELIDPKTSLKLQPMVDQDVQRDAVAWHKNLLEGAQFFRSLMDLVVDFLFVVLFWSY